MKYTGERNSKGKRHGRGTLTYANGATHTGCILWRCVGALGAYS